MFESVDKQPEPSLARWFAPEPAYLRARWLFLRALGAIFFSAFYALWFQIHGLIGPAGILPAGEWLAMARAALGLRAFWLAPTLLWINAGDTMLSAIVIAGLIASVMLTLNLAPRISIGVAVVCFLSFVTAAQDFSAYQSDGMLLEAGFLSLFLAPPGLRPGLGASHPPTRASVFLLQYEWFRIYFESGLVKILSGEPQWRDLTAMDKYYENGPLPTWLGWYVQQWPHSFHAFSAAATLIVELFVVWLLFFGRRSRWLAFAITTPLQLGIILTRTAQFVARCLVRPRHPLPHHHDDVLLPRLPHRRPLRSGAHRQQLRPLRGHDARPLRDRVPGNGRRQDVDRVSVRVQAAGSAEAARHLRAISAAPRLEPLVRIARAMGGESVGDECRGEAARRIAAGAAALRR